MKTKFNFAYVRDSACLCVPVFQCSVITINQSRNRVYYTVVKTRAVDIYRIKSNIHKIYIGALYIYTV